MKKLKPMTALLITTIIVAIVEVLRTGYIDGLCCLWVGPVLIMLEESHWDEWARKKMEEMDDETN